METSQDNQHHPFPGEHHVLENMLEHLVGLESDSKQLSYQLLFHNAQHSAITPAVTSKNGHNKWWNRFFPDDLSERMEELFTEHKMGNFIAVRGQPGQKIFETMPIYVRVGMHLFFYKSKQQSFLRYNSVEELLKSLSIRQGKVYDDESDPKSVLEHIQTFIKTYSIELSELLEPDPSNYPNFNSFFSRKLKPGVRPIAEPGNPNVISSCADCRLTVFDNVEQSTAFWIKGREFTLNRLLGDSNLADRCFPPGSSIAIFRLAPADYHRYHHSVGPVVCGPTRHIDGEYYTVNPQAVNTDFDVFTSNRRDVLLLDWAPNPDGERHTVALIAIGAMLVGSIGWVNANQGNSGNRGDELGYFAYGGSTVILVLPPSAKVQWDKDLLENSLSGLETMVRVGDRLGVSTA